MIDKARRITKIKDNISKNYQKCWLGSKATRIRKMKDKACQNFWWYIFIYIHYYIYWWWDLIFSISKSKTQMRIWALRTKPEVNHNQFASNT